MHIGFRALQAYARTPGGERHRSRMPRVRFRQLRPRRARGRRRRRVVERGVRGLRVRLDEEFRIIIAFGAPALPGGRGLLRRASGLAALDMPACGRASPPARMPSSFRSSRACARGAPHPVTRQRPARNPQKTNRAPPGARFVFAGCGRGAPFAQTADSCRPCGARRQSRQATAQRTRAARRFGIVERKGVQP